MTSRLLHDALAYADMGIAVLPLHTPTDGGCGCRKGRRCKSAGKHPRTANGVYAATIDEEQIRLWWARWPTANVGIATGPASGLIALDVDPRNGGDDELDDLQAEHGALPDTPIALTGGGGYHYFLRWRHEYADLVFAPLRPGIEIQGPGKLVVAAPSLHRSGRQYAWESEAHIGEVPIADAPSWLIAMLGRRGAPTDRSAAAEHKGTIDVKSFPLGAAFSAIDRLGGEMKPGVWAVQCPNEHEHSGGETFDGSTVIMAPRRDKGETRGVFVCLHAHCAGRYQ